LKKSGVNLKSSLNEMKIKTQLARIFKILQRQFQ
jgi:hypothetical protein